MLGEAAGEAMEDILARAVLMGQAGRLELTIVAAWVEMTSILTVIGVVQAEAGLAVEAEAAVHHLVEEAQVEEVVEAVGKPAMTTHPEAMVQDRHRVGAVRESHRPGIMVDIVLRNSMVIQART